MPQDRNERKRLNFGIHGNGLSELVRLAQVKDRRGLREIAADIGVTPSTISRARNCQMMNADSLLLILGWARLVLGKEWNEIMPRVIYEVGSARQEGKS